MIQFSNMLAWVVVGMSLHATYGPTGPEVSMTILFLAPPDNSLSLCVDVTAIWYISMEAHVATTRRSDESHFTGRNIDKKHGTHSHELHAGPGKESCITAGAQDKMCWTWTDDGRA